MTKNYVKLNLDEMEFVSGGAIKEDYKKYLDHYIFTARKTMTKEELYERFDSWFSQQLEMFVGMITTDYSQEDLEFCKDYINRNWRKRQKKSSSHS